MQSEPEGTKKISGKNNTQASRATYYQNCGIAKTVYVWYCIKILVAVVLLVVTGVTAGSTVTTQLLN